MKRLVVYGDLHGAFEERDLEVLATREPDAVVFLGDLARRTEAAPPPLLRLLARVGVPAWWTPGNHDAVGLPQMVAEITGPAFLASALGAGMAAQVARWEEALSPVRLLAWEGVPLGPAWLVGGRPFSLGGPRLAYPDHLGARWGIRDLEASRERLVAAIAGAPSMCSPLIVVGHNGPAGCGGDREAPFGRDFHPDQGDWGDPDLAAALETVARDRPTVVLGGHMHHTLRGGGRRRTTLQAGQRLVVNAARVPRVKAGVRHHVEVDIQDTSMSVWAVAVTDAGEVTRKLLGTVGPPGGGGTGQGATLEAPGVP